MERWDTIVVGAGAAGLMAAIWARRTAPTRRVLLLDGAKTLGAKILVAGGGRCNVTHYTVNRNDFAGSTPNAIDRVLRRFTAERTVEFFAELGVRLKQEETGKLFPVTDRARTVLDALLQAADDAGVIRRNPCRVLAGEPSETGDDDSRFTLQVDSGPPLEASRLILATGGKSLPKSGSDGLGYQIAAKFGLPLTPQTFPALVPLRLPADHFILSLSGVTLPCALELRGTTGKRIHRTEGSTLCTHFGLSGPSVLDMSRHFLGARHNDPDVSLVLNWLPGRTRQEIEQDLQDLGSGTPRSYFARQLPQRLAAALVDQIGSEAAVAGHQLSRNTRKALATVATETPLPIVGDLGYTKAEVTAGGVPLSALRLQTLESRDCPGLFLCGEICDVDGRIGGFNFQWAWASGYVAGTAAAS